MAVKIKNKPPLDFNVNKVTKIITAANQKGGVGKTTTLVHCAYLAEENSEKPCLLIELCPQGNASQTLYGDDYEDIDCIKAYELFDNTDLDGNTLKTDLNIELIPASDELSDLDNVDLDTLMNTFRKKVRMLADSGRWSFIFIDTPPSLGKLQLGGLIAADYVYTPIGLDSFSMKGLEKLLSTIDVVQEEFNPDLEILGILPNQVNANRKEEIIALKEIVEAFGDDVISPPVRDRGPIKSAIDRGECAWRNIRTGNARTAAKEIKAAITEILRRASK